MLSWYNLWCKSSTCLELRGGKNYAEGNPFSGRGVAGGRLRSQGPRLLNIHARYTQAESLEEMREATADAVRCHFDEAERPRLIRLHMVKEEVIAV